VNYHNSLVVTITVTCYSWAPSSCDHLVTCGSKSRVKGCWAPQKNPDGALSYHL